MTLNILIAPSGFKESLDASDVAAAIASGVHAAMPDARTLLAPLVGSVGAAWAAGELALYEEHLFAEMVDNLLVQAIQRIPEPPFFQGARVLLATVPGEAHGLGLHIIGGVGVMEERSAASIVISLKRLSTGLEGEHGILNMFLARETSDAAQHTLLRETLGASLTSLNTDYDTLTARFEAQEAQIRRAYATSSSTPASTGAPTR